MKGAAGERMVDEEKQPLLRADDGESRGVSGREWLTRWILLFSLLLNARLWLKNFCPCSIDPSLGPIELSGMIAVEHNTHFAHPAAVVVETLATYTCSGHGSVLADTPQSNDSSQVVCECHSCFTGPTCAETVPDCPSGVGSGDPVIYEYFWKQNAEAGTLVIPPWYRMSYWEGRGTDTGMTEALEKQIRTLHKMVGNALVEDKHIVVNPGSTCMLNAIVQTLAEQSQDPTAVVSAVPFYELYKRQSNAFGNGLYAWKGDSRSFDQQVGNAGKNTIEFVTYPNNPDFLPREPVINRSNSHTVYDFAYYWPHMQSITRKFDEDIMIFTLSKITGHAGTRVGWAFFRDPHLAEAVTYTSFVNNLGTSHDAIARSTQLLKAVIAGYSNDNGPVPLKLPAAQYAKQGRIFHYGRAVLSKRYKWLVEIMSQSSRFSILKHEPEYCAFFGQTLDPAPAYAWIYCNRDEDAKCHELFRNNGITTYAGESYGVTNRYVRFSLLNRDSDYEILEKYLTKLVAG